MASTNASRPAHRIPRLSPRNAKLALFGLLAFAVLATVATFSGVAPVIEPDATASSAASLAREDLSFRAGIVALGLVLAIQILVAWRTRSRSPRAGSGTEARLGNIVFAALFKVAALIVVARILEEMTSLAMLVAMPDHAVHGRTFPVLVAIPTLVAQLWLAWAAWKRPRADGLRGQGAPVEPRMGV